MPNTNSPPTSSEFTAWRAEDIAHLVQEEGFPKLGVCIIDGTRRLTLATTETNPAEPEFYQAALQLTGDLTMRLIEGFFVLGLQGLVLPLFSQRVLSRGDRYRRDFAVPALQTLTRAAHWKEFYQEHGIRVRFYGPWEAVSLSLGMSEAVEWIGEIQQDTSSHRQHTLAFGVGGSPCLGENAAQTVLGGGASRQEWVQALYGVSLPVADFVLLGGQMAGLGALPPWLCDGDTALYILPVPTLLLSKAGQRRIFFDLLFQRRQSELKPLTIEGRERLRSVYRRGSETIWGIGEQIEGVWLPREIELPARPKT